MTTTAGFTFDRKRFILPPGGGLLHLMKSYNPNSIRVDIKHPCVCRRSDDKPIVDARVRMYAGRDNKTPYPLWTKPLNFLKDSGVITSRFNRNRYFVYNLLTDVDISDIPERIMSASDYISFKKYRTTLYVYYAEDVPVCCVVRPDRCGVPDQTSVDVYYTHQVGTGFKGKTLSMNLLDQIACFKCTKALAVVLTMIGLGDELVPSSLDWQSLSPTQKHAYNVTCVRLSTKLQEQWTDVASCIQCLLCSVYRDIKQAKRRLYGHQVDGKVLASCMVLCNTDWYALSRNWILDQLKQTLQLMPNVIVFLILSYL
jgi:hypothetical protein